MRQAAITPNQSGRFAATCSERTANYPFVFHCYPRTCPHPSPAPRALSLPNAPQAA